MKIHKSWEILAIIAVLALTALILSLIVGCPAPVFVCSRHGLESMDPLSVPVV